jgi:putative transposase
MTHIVGRKFRIYPTKQQKQLLAQTFGCARSVYNWGLDAKEKQYAAEKTNLADAELSRLLTEKIKDPATPWFRQVPRTCLTCALQNLRSAYHNFFKNPQHFKKPEFKSRYNKQSATYQDVVYRDGQFKLPKFGFVKVEAHRELDVPPKMVTISKNSCDQYFMSFKVEVEIEPLAPIAKVVGVDWGCKTFATCSDKTEYHMPKKTKGSARALKRSQRALARAVKDSNRRAKTKQKLAKLHNKFTNQRLDFIHKTTTELVRNNQIICAESLSAKEMLSNHRLAAKIQENAPGIFLNQLKYKSKLYGRTFVQISKWYPSSKTCSCCGYKLKKLPLSTREWTCPGCSTHHNRDLNAANNILYEGLKSLIPEGIGEFTDVDITGSNPKLWQSESQLSAEASICFGVNKLR